MSPNFRNEYYLAKLTRRDLTYVTALTSQSIYQAAELGFATDFWQFVFDSAVAETRRRSESQAQRFAEAVPIRVPFWTGRVLATAMIDSANLTYIPLSPRLAEFADWLFWSTSFVAMEQITGHEDRAHANAY